MHKVVIANFYDGNGQKSGGDYAYFVPPGDFPKPGDLILTSVAIEPTYGADMAEIPSLRTARCAVVSTVIETHPKAAKFYLLLLPHADLLAKRAEQQARLDEAKERRAIQKRLDELLEKQSKIAQYEQLAQTNPEAFTLLKKLKGETIDEEGIDLTEMRSAKPSRVMARAAGSKAAVATSTKK